MAGNFIKVRPVTYLSGAIIYAANHNNNENTIYDGHNDAFHNTTGHEHTGAVGDAPVLGPSSLDLSANYAWTGDHTFTSQPGGIHMLIHEDFDTIDANNYGEIFWKNPRANPTVLLTLIGGLFDSAHYTELRQHNHTGTITMNSHTHGIGTYAVANGGVSHTHGVGTLLVDTKNLSHTHGVGTYATSTTGDHLHGVLLGSSSGSDDFMSTSTGTSAYFTQISPTAGLDDVMSTEGDHTHTLSGSSATETPASDSLSSHTHSLSGNVGNTTSTHSHSLSGNAGNTTSTGSTSINNTGTTTATSLTAAEKDYIDTLQVYIDGVDRTAALVGLADTNYAGQFATLGDGTSGHRLNNETLTSPGPGTGEMDISTYVTTAAFHKLEFRVAGSNGGRLRCFLDIS